MDKIQTNKFTLMEGTPKTFNKAKIFKPEPMLVVSLEVPLLDKICLEWVVTIV